MFQVLTFFFGKDVLLKLILQLISTHSIFLEAEECLELSIVSSVANFGKGSRMEVFLFLILGVEVI